MGEGVSDIGRSVAWRLDSTVIFPYVGADDHTSRDLIVGSRDAADGRWVLLIHQIPPKPDYLRVKIGRRLARVGAIAAKNSVYVWPDSGQALEDFQWIRAEIVAGNGQAFICRADFIDGLTNEEIR